MILMEIGLIGADDDATIWRRVLQEYEHNINTVTIATMQRLTSRTSLNHW